jgi:2-polyprenyl-3-methyl-5-hydroxy-6-metoxy-1,4-benzoquinol methylase
MPFLQRGARAFLQAGAAFFVKHLYPKKLLHSEHVRRTVSLYADDSFNRTFAYIRFWDAPFYEVELKVPKSGRILELGCGEGIMSNYLAVCSPERRVTGIDIDRARIPHADKGLENTNFMYGDVLEDRLPTADAILLNHMLHHLPSFAAQELLLKKCAATLDRGGHLVIAEVNRGPTLKYLLGWLVDVIVVPTLFEGAVYNPNIFHRSSKDWEALLKVNNFTVESLEPSKGRPFPDVIIHARRD